ncbi:MAG TPA: lysophospholipid acyltransferase family protein [Solirubrobacteraceae bacterium]|nr:lysophospholipid acyltransferase family protein [Solirubrobacteraceae bacterium]
MQTHTASARSRNGHSPNGTAAGAVQDDHEERDTSAERGPLERLVQAFAGAFGSRIPAADLDERDPDYIRESLPGLWLAASLWFRGEVRGLGNIPEEGPVLLVGNHSGGNMTPDSLVFTLAFSTYFGVERRFYQLAHNLVLSWPGLGFLRRYGTVAASPENAREALSSGAAVLVYPGGDYEVHRPSWEGDRIDFDGRRGFVRLALDHGVPIVPVVAIGGQETALFLSRGEGLSRLLMLDRLFRLKVLPISIAAPWGLNVGDMLGHIPLPAKITVEVLPAIDLREQFGAGGAEIDVDEVYDHVTSTMQETLDALAAERRLPILG